MFNCYVVVIADPAPLDVCRLLRSRSSEWDDFGRELHIPLSFREGLLRTGPMYSNDAKLERVINNWLESWCSPPTWDYLIEALERLGWRHVAEEVIKYLTTDPEAIKKYNWKGM